MMLQWMIDCLPLRPGSSGHEMNNLKTDRKKFTVAWNRQDHIFQGQEHSKITCDISY